MGVCLIACSIAPANLARLLADPPLVWRLLEADDDSAYLRQLALEARPTLWQRLRGQRPPAPVPQQLALAPGEGRMLDLDKSWDGLRCCLRHIAPQVPDLFAGDGQVGSFEVGYGPALFVRPETLARAAAAFDGLQDAQLLQALRTADFSGAYLATLWTTRSDDAVDYLLENAHDLQDFLRHAAAHGQGAVLQFT